MTPPIGISGAALRSGGIGGDGGGGGGVDIPEEDMWTEIDSHNVGSNIRRAVPSPDNELMAFCDYGDYATRIWEVTNGWDQIQKFTSSSRQSTDAAWHPTDSHLAIAHQGTDYVYIYDTDSWDRIYGWNDISVSNGQWAVDYHPDGEFLAVGTDESYNEVYILDPNDGYDREVKWNGGGEVHTLEFSPDGEYIAVGSETDGVHVMNVERGNWYEVMHDTPRDGVRDLTWYEDGSDFWLYTGHGFGDDGARTFYHYDSGSDDFSRHEIDYTSTRVRGTAVGSEGEHTIFSEYEYSEEEDTTSSETIVDDFEDGSLSEYGGDTHDYTITSSRSYNGSYSVRYDGSGVSRMYSSSGLNYYPEWGDDFEIYFFSTIGINHSSEHRARVEFFQDHSDAYVDSYFEGSNLWLIDSGNVLDSDSSPDEWQDYTWYYWDVETDTSGGISITIRRASDDVAVTNTLSGTVSSTYGPGISIKTQDNTSGSIYYDYWHLPSDEDTATIVEEDSWATAHVNDGNDFPVETTFADDTHGYIRHVASLPGEAVIVDDEGYVTRYYAT